MKKENTSHSRLSIMVSSTVYGIEELLEQIYAMLSGFGYEVWCSHKGTVTVYPHQTALDSCLAAVERCDLFLCIVTPQYGSGVLPDGLGFTHQELLKAIELGKPRWILAHHHVPFARSLFLKLGCKNAREREEMFAKLGLDTKEEKKKLKQRKQAIIIWNSGHLSMGLTPEKLRAATHESILVNPDISHVFYLHELMERVGRGTFKIVQECREMRMRPPVWQSKASGVHLTFFGAGQQQISVKLNERQRVLLNGLCINESIRMDEYVERSGCGISDRQARRDLRYLVDAGLLDPIGAGPATCYRRTETEL